MKINIVLPSIGVSGGINVIYKYVDLLSERGHDVCVYKEYLASNMHRYESKVKNTIHQCYCTFKAVLQKDKWKHKQDIFVFKLTNQSVREADAIIATSWTTAYSVAALSENKGKKYYFIQDYEIWDNESLGKGSYKLPLNKIVISTYINNCLKKDLNIGPFPIIYNGLDLDIYHHVKVSKKPENINFLMLNHTLPKKGVANGLKAFEMVKRKYHNCKLMMFGTCGRDNLPEYVEYYQSPSKDELVRLYSESDIFIFPSTEEGWGLTPLEAMACECIVAGTNVGFVLDIGIHEKNMMISEPGNVDQMVENIFKILDDSKLATKIKINSRITVEKLDWNDSACNLEKIITDNIFIL